MPSTWLLPATQIIFSNIYTLSHLSNCSALMQGRRCSLLGTQQNKEENGRSNAADEKFHHISARCRTDGGELAGKAVGNSTAQDMNRGDPTVMTQLGGWLSWWNPRKDSCSEKAGIWDVEWKGRLQRGDWWKETVACPLIVYSYLGGENTQLPENYWPLPPGQANKQNKPLKRIFSKEVDCIGRELLKSYCGYPSLREQSPPQWTAHHTAHSYWLPWCQAHSYPVSSMCTELRQMLYSHLKSEQRTEGLYIFKVNLQNQWERLL